MSLDSVADEKIDPELKDFIVGEQVKSQIRAQIRRLNNMCFERCFEKPTAKLESKQENCVHNCIGRFLDTNGFIANRFSKRSNASGMD